jgi:tRNA isopentenyl-2-thiomethyl-A-37 hydroxylase MiaE
MDKIRNNLGPVLLDHALERKGATSALTLERYSVLYHKASELKAIAIEELEHFERVLQLMEKRNVEGLPGGGNLISATFSRDSSPILRAVFLPDHVPLV